MKPDAAIRQLCGAQDENFRTASASATEGDACRWAASKTTIRCLLSPFASPHPVINTAAKAWHLLPEAAAIPSLKHLQNIGSSTPSWQRERLRILPNTAFPACPGALRSCEASRNTLAYDKSHMKSIELASLPVPTVAHACGSSQCPRCPHPGATRCCQGAL